MSILQADFLALSTSPFGAPIAADDTIVGTVDNDSLTGASGNDLIQGLEGDDTLLGLAGRDTLDGGAGDDTLMGGDGKDVLIGGTGNNLIDGGRGWDTVDLTAVGPVTGSFNGSVTTASGVDQLVSIEGFSLGAGDDHLVDGHRSIIIHDAGGNNYFELGKSGDRVFLSGDGDNTVYGGGGLDVIHGAAGDDQLFGGGTLKGGAGDDRLIGGGILDGGAGNDYFQPGDGITTINGGKGFDTIDYSTLHHGTSVDMPDGKAEGLQTISKIEGIIGTDFNDTIVASEHSVRFDGGGGEDVMVGGAGNDTLVGGLGSDTLAGGAGSNAFEFLSVAESTVAAPDVIQDLTDADTIRLNHIDGDTTLKGNQAFHLAAALDGHAGELVLSYDAGRDQTTIQGDVNGDGIADFSILVDGDRSAFTNFVL